jgi:hypothetical protein
MSKEIRASGVIGDFECCARHSQPGMGIAAEGRLWRRFGYQSRQTPASLARRGRDETPKFRR